MAGKSRFIIAVSKIKKFFQSSKRRVFTKKQLELILHANMFNWNLPASMDVDKFIEKCVESFILNEIILESIETEENFIKRQNRYHAPTYPYRPLVEKKYLYTVGEVSVYDVALNIKNRTYLSYFTAVYIHGLTTQIPKVINVSFEQSFRRPSITKPTKMKQENIDMAFAKPQRKSSNIFTYGDYSFLIHSSMFTDRTGIYTRSEDGLILTNIERTLIDIAVRPEYAGGVDAVLDAYRKAKDKVSLNKLAAYLNKLNFTYPYWQVIGFYLEHAGYEKYKLAIFSSNVSEYLFYLTYAMKDVSFDSKWQVYYPKGLI